MKGMATTHTSSLCPFVLVGSLPTSLFSEKKNLISQIDRLQQTILLKFNKSVNRHKECSNTNYCYWRTSVWLQRVDLSTKRPFIPISFLYHNFIILYSTTLCLKKLHS